MKNKYLVVLASLLMLASCEMPSDNSSFISSSSKDDSSSAKESEISKTSTVSDLSEYISEQSSASTPLEKEIVSTFEISSSIVDGYTIDENIYSINKAGTYTLSGKLEDGQVVVNVGEDDEVKLILNETSITCSFNSAILINEADKVIINLASESYNELTDTRSLKSEDIESQGEGVISSASDLNIAGSGSLNVVGSYNNGIHSKKDLKIKNATIKVTAPNNAIKGKDSLTIESGNIVAISSGGDGLKSEDSDISSKGNQRGDITISGGNVDIYAACDGIDASNNVYISGDANVNIYTDKYSSYTKDVITSSDSEMYIKLSEGYYDANYRYSLYYYNDSTSYTWSNATLKETVSGMSGKYYYLTAAIPSGYDNFVLYRFAANDDNSYSNYSARSEGQAVNKDRDLITIKFINTNTKKITFSLSTYKQSVNTNPWGQGGSGNSDKSEYSTKGIKADNEIYISGGNILVESNDDAIHANSDVTLENGNQGLGNVYISGGKLILSSIDDGIHGDYIVEISGGYIQVVSSYEGIEGNLITFKGGQTYVYAKDDGLNATGSKSTPIISVESGYIDVCVGSGDTDGIDSNGSYNQSGGFVISRTSTNDTSGNASPLDLDGQATITGGTLITFGTIARTPTTSLNRVIFGSSSTSGRSGMMQPGGGFGGRGGTSVSGSISFASGDYQISNTSISFTLSATYSGLMIISEEFKTNESYTLSSASVSKTWTQNSSSVSVN